MSHQHLGSAALISIINKRTENGNLQMRLEFLAVPKKQRNKKGHQVERWAVTIANILVHVLLKSFFPWSPSMQMSERGNNTVSIKYLEMVWTEAQETLVYSHTHLCIWGNGAKL